MNGSAERDSTSDRDRRRLCTTESGHGYEDYLVFVVFWILAAIVCAGLVLMVLRSAEAIWIVLKSPSLER